MPSPGDRLIVPPTVSTLILRTFLMRIFRPNLAGMVVLLVGAAVLLLTMGVGSGRIGWTRGEAGGPRRKELKTPPTRIAANHVEPETIDIIHSYSGTIRPFERHTASFEVMGRVEALGKDAQGKILDVGSVVTPGQVLATLDNIERLAMLDETNARLEKAQAERQRYERLRTGGDSLVTEERWLAVITETKTTDAAKRRMEKQLQDATLRAPEPQKPRDDGQPSRFRISKRMINVGASVNAHQAVFELIESDRVRLVVGVPEAKIRDVKVGQRAQVERFAQDLFGQKLPLLEGRVYQVAEAADASTGLFEVEVLLYNDVDELKPGMFAMAHVVVDQLRDGFRLPLASVVHRDGQALLFYVDGEMKARALPVARSIEQGPHVLLEQMASEHRHVVVRGQHRLVDGREVELVSGDLIDAGEPAAEVRVVAPQ